MAIYKMVGDKEKFAKVDPTSFGQAGVLERADLQRILRDQPDVLEEGLLIISEEFGNWEDSNRRIDLLGLDVEGRLVVIELKRGDTGQHMDLQAIRYAAMVANMTFQQAVDTYQAYLEQRASEPGRDPVEEGDAETLLQEHLQIAELDHQAIHTKIPRIILASENFGKELTTCVMWLNDSWLRNAEHEIKCVRLQPHRNGKEILIETSVVVPLPEATEYQTRLGQREQEIRSGTSGKVQNIKGVDAFKESIGRAPEKFRSGLERLCSAAIMMEQENTADLSTYISRKGEYYRINLAIPGTTQVLVSFNNLLRRGKERGGEISFWPTESELAPNSLGKIDDLIGEVKSSSGVRHRRLSRIKQSELDPILIAVRGLYREANHIPVEV